MSNPEAENFYQPEQDNGAEQEPRPQTIAEVLPRYYEAYGEDPQYETLRSMAIDGHEVAWMEYKGYVDGDITGEGKEGEFYAGKELRCTCDFTEGVGWQMDEKFAQPVGIGGGEKCLQKKAAVYLRHIELNKEYKDKDLLDSHMRNVDEDTEAIMFDLIEKSKAGEFLEPHSGAEFWGGYYYLQTVRDVTGLSMKRVREVADKLVAEKKIDLEGAVVQPHIESEPVWDTELTYESDGWVATAALPAHSKMPQTWKFEVIKPSGEMWNVEIPNEPLEHDPVFGLDGGDVSRVKQRLAQIVEQAIWEQSQ